MLKKKFMVAALILSVATSTIAGAGGLTAKAEIGPGMGMSASVKDNTPKQLRVVHVGNGTTTLKESSKSIVKAVEPYTYDFMMHDLEQLRQKFPAYMRYRSLGTTADGRQIVDCTIGSPSAQKHILIQAGIHGREYVNSLLMMQVIEYALENYNSYWDGISVRSMFEQVQLHILPMVNPDGVTISQLGIDGLNSQQVKDKVLEIHADDVARGYFGADLSALRYWKNNAMGVDVNENFDCYWQSGGKKVKAPSSLYYKGPYPVSEPESRALVNLINSHSNWKFTISVHSTGSLIYMDTVGNKVYGDSAGFAWNVHELSGYEISGEESSGRGFKDWCQTRVNPIPSVTIETGTRSCPDNFVEYDSIWNKNKNVWLYELRYAYEH